jgi:hypothetical protein
VSSAGRIDHQGARRSRGVLIPLRSGQDKDVLVAKMLMHRKLALPEKPDQGGRGPGHTVPVEPMNLDSLAKRLPRNLVRVLGEVKQVRQFQARETRRRIRFQEISRCSIARRAALSGKVQRRA